MHAQVYSAFKPRANLETSIRSVCSINTRAYRGRRSGRKGALPNDELVGTGNGVASFSESERSDEDDQPAQPGLVPQRTPPPLSTPGTPSFAGSPASRAKAKLAAKQMDQMKFELLASVASLDRGLGANAQEAADVDSIASRIEELGGPVTLQHSWEPATATASSSSSSTFSSGSLEMLAGTWRLVYSSGFNSGSLGGRRPGPPAGLVPATLGQVYQRINPETGNLDNIVELLFSVGLPFPLSLLTGQQQQQQQPVDSPAARLTLRHDYEVLGGNTVQIVFEKTFAELVGSSMFASLPKFALPELPDLLKPPKGFRSATFDVTFLDPMLRITRGDRGELRIYLKDHGMDAPPPPPPDYED